MQEAEVSAAVFCAIKETVRGKMEPKTMKEAVGKEGTTYHYIGYSINQESIVQCQMVFLQK